MKKTNKKGFTLVELVIVIAVLLILAAVAIPTVSGVIARANEATDAANAKSIETAIKYALVDNETNNGTAANVGDALALSGMANSILTPKQSGKAFGYNPTTNAVTIVDDDDDTAITAATTIS